MKNQVIIKPVNEVQPSEGGKSAKSGMEALFAVNNTFSGHFHVSDKSFSWKISKGSGGEIHF